MQDLLLYQGEKMGVDLLWNAAVIYGELNNVGYSILLGRKKQMYQLDICFPYESFYHLAGLQHLPDITYPSKNKERIYKDICNRKIKYETIAKSAFFKEYNIKERLENLPQLEKMLDNTGGIFRINRNLYREYTTIKADYLVEYIMSDQTNEILYFFLIAMNKQQSETLQTGCSFFKRHDIDYSRGTAKTTLLLAEKTTDLERGSKILLYRNPNYKKD